jgi:hypothetical protein
VTSQSIVILVLASFCLSANAQSPAKTVEQVRRIILRSQHLEAHGMGYNGQSQNMLSQKLTPAGCPTHRALCDVWVLPPPDCLRNHNHNSTVGSPATI